MSHSKQSSPLRIRLIGDYSPQVRAHITILQALALAAPADFNLAPRREGAKSA
jgi:CTP synthase (UTP-ammonia lyase)